MSQATPKTTLKPEYVIRKRRTPHWYWSIALLIFTILVIAIALGYWLNQKRYDFSETTEQQFDQLQSSLEASNAIAIRWQQQFEVEKEVNQQLRKHLMELQIKLDNSQKEQQAYQRIFAPNSVESGLQIASFVWEPVEANSYSYRLILIQAKDHRLNISGKFEINIIGSENGQEKTISFASIANLNSKSSKFRFKYMHNQAGNFSIPENFKPQLIRVMVTSSGKAGKSILQDFDWPVTQTTTAQTPAKPGSKLDQASETLLNNNQTQADGG